MSHDQSFANVETRCSIGAGELLHELVNYANLPELLALLENIDGRIYKTDVEGALLAVKRQFPEPFSFVSSIVFRCTTCGHFGSSISVEVRHASATGGLLI